ncbi:MAG: sugar ABC transporter ATP-binding protein [Phycisphaerales bacterium]
MLILDEPTSSLARPDVQRLFALVRRLRGAGCAIVYISHFLEEVQEIADVFTVLRDGRTVGGGAVPATSPKAMASLMVGRTIDELFPRSPRTPGEVVVEIDRLSGRVLPREATLSLRRGEVVGIAGLVGAGRTELLRALFGLDVVRAGRVRVATFSSHRAARRAAGGAFVATASATDVPAALGGSTSATPRSRWRGGMGFVPEDRKRDGLMLGRSIAENIAITRLRAIASPRSIAAASRPWIERLGIRCAGPDQRVAALSGGNQQKVVMARLLRHGCDILLLDEPTRGVDVGAKATIHRIVDEAATGADGRPPCAVLLASSSLPELLGVCDRIAVMCRGSLGPARRVAEWDEHRLMRAATGVADAGDGAESAGRGAHEGGRS